MKQTETFETAVRVGVDKFEQRVLLEALEDLDQARAGIQDRLRLGRRLDEGRVLDRLKDATNIIEILRKEEQALRDLEQQEQAEIENDRLALRPDPFEAQREWEDEMGGFAGHYHF